jgi:hypothetical protein
MSEWQVVGCVGGGMCGWRWCVGGEEVCVR